MREAGVSLEELKVIPYFDASAWKERRFLSCLSFYAKGEWHCWLPIGNRLQKMKMQPVQASYFGDAPERPTDQSFQFFHLTEQRASFPEMFHASRGIWNDFQNFATSLAKIKLFHEVSKTQKLETVRFVQTEIEYIVSVARGVYDLLQEMIASHWERIELFEKPKHKKKLPKSFADVVFHTIVVSQDGAAPVRKEVLRSAEQIRDRYGLPQIFADWFESQGPFFGWVRSLRNNMAHGGSEAVKLLYSTERGFAIHRNEKPWTELYEWPSKVELPNQLVPIRPVLCAIIWNVIQSTDSFARVLEKTIKLPAELFPGMRYYSRGYYDREFYEIAETLHHSWWCDQSASPQVAADEPPAAPASE